MSFEIAVAGNDDFTLGFRLAGIKKAFNLEKTPIKSLLSDKSIGILILNGKDVDAMPEHAREEARNSVSPVTVILSENAGEEDALRKMIKKAMGVDLWK